MQRKDSNKKRLGYINFCLSKTHEIPLTKITLNRVKKHVSVEGQKVIRTCDNGSLKYHKFQNIGKEDEVDCEQRRRLRGRYTDQQEKQTNGEGGGRQALRFIDGDVPLCIRSREEMIKEPEKVKGSSEETNEGSGSYERTRKEAKSENKANDTSSSSSTKENNAQCETDDEKKKSYFCRASEEHEVIELK